MGNRGAPRYSASKSVLRTLIGDVHLHEGTDTYVATCGKNNSDIQATIPCLDQARMRDSTAKLMW